MDECCPRALAEVTLIFFIVQHTMAGWILDRLLRVGRPTWALTHLLKLRFFWDKIQILQLRREYILAPNTASCMQWYGPHRVTGACYPKCPNDAHLVRKVCMLVYSIQLYYCGLYWD